jgi:hypothetical protein
MYSKEELSFILFNNRSVNGVVRNFLPTNIDPYKLISLENNFEKIKSMYNTSRLIEVNSKELDLTSKDEIVTKKQLEELTDLIIENVGSFNQREYEYLINRGVGEMTILSNKLLGLSAITDKEHLRILGATVHPILRGFLDDGLRGGGIIIPLFEKGKLVNCSIRKITTENNGYSKTLKYTLACPDVPVWGLENIEEDKEIWLTEGIFDMIAVNKMGKNAVSCSSAMWSGIQLYQILQKEPSNMVIVADNDEVGLRTASILKDFFEYYLIPSRVVVSKFAKDAAEHYFQKTRNLSDFIEIDITDEMIISTNDDKFDFLKHLKNRTF